MTDSEIVKGLECCILGDCQGCFYGDTDQRHCKDDLMQNALDLINRQKAEIFKEKNKNSKLRNERNRLKAEVERLTAERDAMHQDVIAAEEYVWQCKTAKVEAIKEFAERVEPLKKFRSCMGNSVYELSVTMREIDDILKEMVGDNNAE